MPTDTTPTKNESLPELLPCPFCGKSNALDQYPSDFLDATGANVVRCAWCHGAAPLKTWNRRAALTREAPTEAVGFTTGHCEYKKQPGGCPHHNLQCGYPSCDRRPATPPAPQRLAQGDSAVALEVYLSTTWGSAAMRIEALATWLDQQEENCGLLSIAAADLRAMSAKLYSEPTGEGDSWFADALTSMGEVIPLPTQPPHQDRGEGEQRAIKLLADACCVSPAIIEDNAATGDVSMRISLRAIVAALTEAKQQGPGEAVPSWIVNDLGELGVMVSGVAYFLYKGDNIVYEDAKHDDGSPMLYRMVGKREFGETCWPRKWVEQGHREDRYTVSLTYTPGLSFGKPEDGDWRPLPTAPQVEATRQAGEECYGPCTTIDFFNGRACEACVDRYYSPLSWPKPVAWRALGKPCAEGTQWIQFTHNIDTAAEWKQQSLDVTALYETAAAAKPSGEVES